MRILFRAALFSGCVLGGSSILLGQRGGGDWMTAAYDPQRSSWVRFDGKISLDSMMKPGFQLLWKYKLNAPGKNPTPPSLLDFYISYRGFRTLGFFGTSDKVVGIDTDLGRNEWDHPFPSTPVSSPGCPGGITANVTRPTTFAYPGAAGRPGRGTPAKSGVGDPLDGAVTLRDRPPQLPAPTPPPSAAAAGRRTPPPPPNPFAPRAQYAVAITADGNLHMMYVSNGEEPNTSIPFIPANANARGLIVFDGVAYVATVNGCGGAANGLWALNLESKQVTRWKAPGNVAGSAGAAVGPDGTLYVASEGTVTALEPGTLKVEGTHSAGGVKFTSTPVVFDFKGRPLLAVAASDGTLHLVDPAAMDKTLAKSAAYTSANFDAGSLTSWQDAAGVRWVLAAGNTGITAFKVTEKGGAFAFERGWVSKAMTNALPPAVVNGVVFAVAGGGVRGTLHALDALSGKELWNSGASIVSPVKTGGVAAGGGRIYVAGTDGMQYAFGFPMEH